MFAPRIVVVGVLVAVALAGPSRAQEPESVSLEAVLARARERAPAVLVARSRIDEARSALVAASVTLQENPEISAAAGPRWAGSGTHADFNVGVSQFFEIGGRRGARLAMASAEIEAAAADADRALRDTLRAAASGYYRIASAIELIDILSTARDMAAEVESIAARRFALGDVAVLDVNVAKATRARAEADVSAARADLARQYGELAGLLNWPDMAARTLDRPVMAPREVDAASLARGLTGRPDLAAIEALQRSAEAEQRLARGSRRPEVGISVDVDREEGDTALIGGFVVRLPVFQRGEGQAAAASARLARLRLERAAAQVAAETTLNAAVAAYRSQTAAVRALETDAIPATVENERLARRSYESGQISLADWLLYRREFLDTLREHVDKKLTCALTLIEIDTIAGVLR